MSASDTVGLGKQDLLRTEPGSRDVHNENVSKPSYAKAYTIHGCLAAIAVAMLVFGILGLTKTSVFGDMGSTTAKALTGVGGALTGLLLPFITLSLLRKQNQLAGSEHVRYGRGGMHELEHS